MTFEAQPIDDEEPQLNITPMVDMVFNLLAFFVLTTSFLVERNIAAGSERPVDRASPATASGDLPERVVVRLTAATPDTVRITVGQTPLPDNGFEQITAKLVEVNLPSVPVVIAAERTVSVDAVARAMDAVIGSPMKRLTLAGLSREGP